MDTSRPKSKLKWGEPGDPTKFELHYPPHESPRKVLQWHNWLKAMFMDMRLNCTDRTVLAALASFYNTKTGDCFPAVGRFAIQAGLGEGETGSRTARRSLAKAAELGWIRRYIRRGGQTNLYDLTLPREICEALASINYQPRGPAPLGYKYPTGQNRNPTGQIRTPNRAIDPSITANLNCERIEPSAKTSAPAPLAVLAGAEEISERRLRAREQDDSPSGDPPPSEEEQARIAKGFQDLLRTLGRTNSMPGNLSPV
jgi:hypothetical protein